MCHGPYAPPLLVWPLYVVGSALNFASSVDGFIRSNNQKLVEFFKAKSKEYHHQTPNALDSKTSISIEEIRTTNLLPLLEQEDREELAKLLIQRAIARIELSKFEEAKQDMLQCLSLMSCNTPSSSSTEKQTTTSNQHKFTKNSYLSEYLLGMCEDGLGNFQRAAEIFQNAIQHREELEAHFQNSQRCHEDTMNEEALIQLEKEFFQMQLEAKKPTERTLMSFSKGMNDWNQAVSNLSGSVKNFFNHDMGLNVSKPVLKPKPRTLITLELLYIRAGVSFYRGAFYSDALKYFTRAIALGEEYESSLLESSYFNRGLCYYYLHELDQALNDFTTSISLMPTLTFQREQRDQVYITRAATYGRKGMTKERDADIFKAKLINPFAKPVSLFHYRLLDDDTLLHIFSYLETRELIASSSTEKYWRCLIQKFISENDIEISVKSLTFNALQKSMDSRNTISKLFLPHNRMEMHAFVNKALENSILTKYAKRLIVYDSRYYEQHYSSGVSLLEATLERLENLERLTFIMPESDNRYKIPHLLASNCPNLKYLHYISGKDSYMSEEGFFVHCISKLLYLEHVIIEGPVQFHPRSNPFSNNTHLKLVEYECSFCGEDWSKLAERNPNVQFVFRPMMSKKGYLRLVENDSY
ncbi:hypothetical protein C9374_002728 [Naegleria lovaniensis]|uniref:F-box domain-containing protein n=1 Tax=Naegleria lovaniensis TaxID=51637 RepID=A0AA88GSL8_NAELO|nr:uncharacterized protein C9374_002728 [Naegleria lovaniensis]KAG2386282.1 hypothetical protein C9374_002728 [Naegleria lovaniensis]